MSEQTWLAERFEAHRTHLEQVAKRILGSQTEASDAVQEAWIRFSRSEPQVDNLGGWLTTVVARVCLDMLRSRRARREDDTVDAIAEAEMADSQANPDEDRLTADAVGLALMVVLEQLAPAERVAFVLHDLFDVPFEEIARILDRSPVAARQLASRARRRVQGAGRGRAEGVGAERRIVEAFLAASRQGDVAGLLALLDPEVVFRADPAAVRLGGPTEARGAEAVAAYFKGRAQAGEAVLIDRAVGVRVAPKGRLLVVLRPTITDGRITRIDAVADRGSLDRLEILPFAD
jgi:RNA polymerase sigma-70 factor, ECF subfamily